MEASGAHRAGAGDETDAGGTRRDTRDRDLTADRGPAAYLGEFLGTLLLVFFVTLVVSVFLDQPSAQNPAPFIDWSVIGLVHAFLLFVLVQSLAIVSGAHFNPAITAAMAALRQIGPVDAAIYVLAQLAGAVAGALLTKLLLNDFTNAKEVNFGAVAISEATLNGKVGLGMLAEFLGAFLLMFTIAGVAVDPRTDRALGPWAIGAALGLLVMVMGSLTGASFNPARAFGADLVGGEFGGVGEFLLAYVLAPILGALAAGFAYFYIFMSEGKKGLEGLDPVG